MSALPRIASGSTSNTAPGAATNPRQRPRTSRQKSQGFSASASVGNSRELFDGLQRSKQVESELRTEIQKLTTETRTLKARLDGLRKAKTQTVVKRETAEDDWQRRDSGCKCSADVAELRRQLTEKEKEWRQQADEMERCHREEVGAARLEARRARPKTASRELLEVSQAEISRLRGIVADQQAKLKMCEVKSASHAPVFDINAEISQRIDELAKEIKRKEQEFRDHERKLREELSEKCKRTHQLWMTEAQKTISTLANENKELRFIVETQKKLLTIS